MTGVRGLIGGRSALPRQLLRSGARAAPTVTMAAYGAARRSWQRPSVLRSASPADADHALLEHVWTYGWALIPGFLDPATCDRLCAEWERVAEGQPDAVQVSPDGADRRLFGLERASELARTSFSHEPRLQGLCDAWYGTSAPPLATLAGRLSAREGNAGSGQGWHRDNFSRQFKAIAYLTDVDDTNGPFQYLTGSHRMGRVVGDTRRARLTYLQNRLSDEEVRRLISRDPGRLKTFGAEAGTVILADTSGIHRGKPIDEGIRYALTNYYYPRPRHDEPGLIQHFAPYVEPAGDELATS